jgi:hypothetical protein
MVIEIVAAGGLAATALQVWLMVRRPPGAKLPRPAKIGLPSGGLASPAAVHAALMGRSARPWWKFW